jgi:hypothetical protein
LKKEEHVQRDFFQNAFTFCRRGRGCHIHINLERHIINDGEKTRLSIDDEEKEKREYKMMRSKRGGRDT